MTTRPDDKGCVQTAGESDPNQMRFSGLTVHAGLWSDLSRILFAIKRAVGGEGGYLCFLLGKEIWCPGWGRARLHTDATTRAETPPLLTAATMEAMKTRTVPTE